MDKKDKDFENLFNPAFCGYIIYSVVDSFMSRKEGDFFPWALSYTILPFILPDRINKRMTEQSLQSWISKNPDSLMVFQSIVSDCVEMTNEAILFMIQQNIIQLKDSCISIPKKMKIPKKYRESETEEVKDCVRRAKKMGAWLATAGPIENIFFLLGVRP